jgi:hypothetical protein
MSVKPDEAHDNVQQMWLRSASLEKRRYIDISTKNVTDAIWGA